MMMRELDVYELIMNARKPMPLPTPYILAEIRRLIKKMIR